MIITRCRASFTAIATLLSVLPLCAAEPIGLELNGLENSEGRCRVSFVIENKDPANLEGLRLELAVFSRDGVARRPVAIDMGPLRGAKTMVKAFLIDGGCAEIGAILVNDVTACAPGDPNACLDRLSLSSRVKDVRFYK
jgi:hypothetical protein